MTQIFSSEKYDYSYQCKILVQACNQPIETQKCCASGLKKNNNKKQAILINIFFCTHMLSLKFTELGELLL